MSKVELFNEFLSIRLPAAVAAEISAEAEKMFRSYQREIDCAKEEIARLQRLLDLVFKPDLKLWRTDSQRDGEASAASKKEPSNHQDDFVLEINKSETVDFPDPPRNISTGLKEDPSDDQDIYVSRDFQQKVKKEEIEVTLEDMAEDVSTEVEEEPTDDQDINSFDGLPSINDEMEYILGKRRRAPTERVHYQRTSYLGMTEQECRNRLHLSREVVHVVTRIVASDANSSSTCALPVAVKVTAALTFFATRSFQHTVGSLAGISQTAVSAAIRAVTASLVRHANEHIIFPSTPKSQLETKRGFLSKCGFPEVLGAIGCTHVQLRAPDTQAITYVNRKGVHSINIQVICDSNCLVTHVYANFPGSVHDSFILANSVIPTVFQGDTPLDGWLLGHNGYPLKTWLMTPYITPTTKRHRDFNRVISSARSVIERTFGLIKMRFRCLGHSGGSLTYSPQRVSAFFVACCVLHNIATRRGCRFHLTEETLQDIRRREAELHVPHQQGEQQSAKERRDQLAAQLCP